MKTAIDSAGRLVVPKKILQEVNLKPGAALEISVKDGRIEIEPAPLQVRMVRKGRVVVAVPTERVEPLTAEAVESVREKLHSDRV